VPGFNEFENLFSCPLLITIGLYLLAKMEIDRPKNPEPPTIINLP
jgi:hypothetical protein